MLVGAGDVSLRLPARFVSAKGIHTGHFAAECPYVTNVPAVLPVKPFDSHNGLRPYSTPVSSTYRLLSLTLPSAHRTYVTSLLVQSHSLLFIAVGLHMSFHAYKFALRPALLGRFFRSCDNDGL